MKSISETFHEAVLPGEVLQALNIRPAGVYADFTAGGGSHSRAILEQLDQNGRLIAGDRDQSAVQAATAALTSVGAQAAWEVRHRSFGDLADELVREGIMLDGMLADLGVSSHQLDTPERGYSYKADGPLDMRMDVAQGETAADIVNLRTAEELTDIFRRYGEERHARRIADYLVKRRNTRPFFRTLDLADAVATAMPAAARREAQHPARRVFQALRIEVNSELAQLEHLLDRVPALMRDRGRVLFITFHSLEDRLVKRAMTVWQSPCDCPRHLPCTCGQKPLGKQLNRGGVTAGETELKQNRRSKSARLRIFEIRKEQ